MTERPSHYRRRVIAALTPRQREVLDLLARGYTNAQVAAALGISLDTAKFHVSEILSRLEVTSREDAVELWKRRERLPVLRRFGGLIAVSRLSYLAGGGALAAFAVLAIAVAAVGDEERPGGPGVYVALLEPPGERETAGYWAGPIRVLELSSGSIVELDRSAHYFDIAWAPDGSRLAGLALEYSADAEPYLVVRTWSPDGSLLAEHLAPPPHRWHGQLAWSPDSTRLAVTGEGILVLTADLDELGWVAMPPRIGGGATGIGVPPHWWSSDSRYIGLFEDDLLMIADRNGEATVHEIPPTFGSYHGWAGDQLALTVPVGGVRMQRLGTLDGGVITWSPPSPVLSQDVDEALIAELNGLVPPLTYGYETPSADGGATAYLLRAALGRPPSESVEQPRPAALVVRARDEQTVIDLGTAFAHGLQFDLVVSPRWDGSLPPALDAALHLDPIPTPTNGGYGGPTVVRGSPGPLHTPVPDATLPTPAPLVVYPTPAGDTVLPQVAGVPLIPGAIEVDGFIRPNQHDPGVVETVQVYEATATADDLAAFYNESMLNARFSLSGGQWGPGVYELEFVRGKDTVLISTAYIPRPGDPHASGYAPAAEIRPGVRLFFVVTLRAP